MKRALKYGCGTMAALILITLAVLAYLVFVRTDGQYFQSDGARIFYTDEGEGEPVILVHGYGANADLNWRRSGVVGALNGDFRVITFDLRAHGLSDKLYEEDAYGVKMVEDVIALMDHLKIEKAHVAGYSLGGFIVLKLAALHPDRLKSVAICAAGWRDPKDNTELLNPYRPPQTASVGRASVHVSRTLAQASLVNPQPQASPPPAPAPPACDWHPSLVADRSSLLDPPSKLARLRRGGVPASSRVGDVLLRDWASQDSARGDANPPVGVLSHVAVIAPLEWKGFTHWVRNFVGDRIVDKAAMKTSKKTWPALMVTEESLKEIQVPMICFIGTRDGLLPYAELLHEKRPDIEYVVLSGKGHMSTAVSWEFHRRLREFFLAHREEARSGERGAGSGELKSGERGAGSGELKSGERGAGSAERGVGSGEWGAEEEEARSGERGAGS